jgi:hypothetical protein
MKRSYECSGDYNCQHDCEDKNCCSAVAHANLLQQNVTQSFRMVPAYMGVTPTDSSKRDRPRPSRLLSGKSLPSLLG